MLINNGNTLPQSGYKTDVKTNSFQVSQNDMSLIIKTLDAETANGWGNISIKIIQICVDPIALPPMLLFETASKEKKSPDIRKKANVGSCPQKRRKELIKSLTSHS